MAARPGATPARGRRYLPSSARPLGTTTARADRLLQRDRLTVVEDRSLGGWCESCNRLGERRAWQIDQVGPLRKAERPPGSPVHRDRVPRSNRPDDLSRLTSIEMAPAEGRAPAAHRHEGEVDLPHLVEREGGTGVARVP